MVEEALPIFEELHKMTHKTEEICELISKFPEKCQKMNGNPVEFLRNSIKNSDQKGVFWTYLAEFFIRQGQFGLARDIFEESLQMGLETV